ncbi:MAG: FtsX-like permease family protein [Streptosporangiaceae bacterium]
MIELGLRMVVNGGREAITRLVILALSVGVGVGLLLTVVAATNAVSTWNGRHAWFWTGTAWVTPGPAAGVSPLWWHPRADIFDGRRITRFDVAATGASSPVPPGIPGDPGPGQYYASPALVALLRSTPAGQLADRYPGHLAGVIGDAALPSPDSLVVIVGRTAAQLAHTPDSARVTSIATTVPHAPGGPQSQVNPQGLTYQPWDGGAPASATDLILSVVALAILAPVLIFIATATRLSAARREERLAAMRLVGATRMQVSLLAATESATAALVGVAVGFVIFFGLRIPAAGIPFIGQRFFLGDLSLSLPDIFVVVIGVPAAAAVAARLALRQVHISPLGVARRSARKPLRAWRLVPLLAGLAEFGFFSVHGHPAAVSGELLAYVSSFGLIILGLVIAGPWLTMAVARAMARWTSRPGTLIAARRLADDPRAAFRAVSGLVLALFITTVAVAASSTQDARNLNRWGSAAEANVLTDQVSMSRQLAGISSPRGIQGTVRPGPAAPAASLTARLSRIPGVQGVIVVRADPGLTIAGTFHNLGSNLGSPSGPVPAGVVSCAQLAIVPALGRCPAGATTAAFPSDGISPSGPLFGIDATTITWPAANVPATRLDTLRVDAINVATDGRTAAVEQARTLLENAPVYPAVSTPSTIGDIIARDNTTNKDYQQLANVAILVSLLIASCTLAAGVAAGLAERKRPFSLLRLTGARLATLRRVVALEGAVPLLAVAVAAIGIGFAAAAMYASEVQKHPMVAPGAEYYLLTAGGIIVSLGIIAATFPLLARITGPEVARNE